MKPDRSLLLIVCAGSLSVGTALGWFLHEHSGAPPLAAPRTTSSPAPTPAAPAALPPARDDAIARSVREGEVKDLRDENQRLRAQIEHLQAFRQGEKPALPGALTLEQINLRGYVGNGASLNPDLARFFGLTPEQETAINREIKAVYDETQRRISENARLESSSPDKVVVKSAGFPEQAKAMEERLKATVLEVAGEETGEQLLYFLVGPRGRNFSSGFGDYTVTFAKAKGTDGKPLFEVTQAGANGSMTSRSSDSSVFREDKQYGTFFRFIPPDFLPADLPPK